MAGELPHDKSGYGEGTYDPDENLAADSYEWHRNPDGSTSRSRPMTVQAEAAAAMGVVIRNTLAERQRQTDALAEARMLRENLDS